VGNTTFKGQNYSEDYVKKLLSNLNLFIVDKALAMTTLSMDDAIERVLTMLPEYFKNNASVQNYTNLKDNLADVQKMLGDNNGLKLVKNVALKNYNHNKTRAMGA
jgi:hypothetical protein